MDITVMSDKELRATKLVKPPSETPQDQWMAQKVSKGPPPKVASQARTQKRRQQQVELVQKMRSMLHMLTTSGSRDTDETPVGSVATTLEQAFPKPTEVS